MLLDEGEIIHVIERRMFETDIRRHFLGQVKRVTETGVRVEGYPFVFDNSSARFERKQNRRIRIISLVNERNLINVLPSETDIEAIEYIFTSDNRLVVTDGKNFELSVNEFTAMR